METQSAFARRLGVSKSYVTGLKQAGRLVMTERGRVDVDASMLRLQETADPARDDVASRWARLRGNELNIQLAGQGMDDEADDAPEDAASNETFAAARARKMAADANMAELELRKIRGELADVAAVRRAGADIGAIVRSHIERLVDDVVPIVAPNDQARARAVMIEHAEAALAQISNGIHRAVGKVTQ